MLRAMFRLFPYLAKLWGVAGRVDVMHILANSGWAWHLFVTPAVVIGRLRGTAVIVNYHGGSADTFFANAPGHVLRMLTSTSMRVVPSAFLLRIFAKYGLSAEVIPNTIDLRRFVPAPTRAFGQAPHLIVTRNLEPVYDVATAIRAFARIRASFPEAQLTIAGSGPEHSRLQALVAEFGLDASVRFSGRIDNADIPQLYASADCLINPSTVDNMPISILEAFASGVPVVSTCAGGVPDMLEDGVSGMLAPIGDDAAMAEKVLTILETPSLAARLRSGGLTESEKYGWATVQSQWLSAYRQAAKLGTNP